MTYRIAAPQDHSRIAAFYRDVIERTPRFAETVRWKFGQHPSPATLERYIADGEMYLWEQDGRLLSVMALTSQDEDYRAVPWQSGFSGDEVVVAHIFAVSPDYHGSGTAQAVMRDALALAKSCGKKALRLDTLSTNIRAQRFYTAMGFRYCGKQRGFPPHLMPDGGEFFYYEYPLL